MKKIFGVAVLGFVLMAALAFAGGSHGPYFWYMLPDGSIAPVGNKMVYIPGGTILMDTNTDNSVWSRTATQTLQTTDPDSGSWTGFQNNGAGGTINSGIAFRNYDVGNNYGDIVFATRGPTGWNGAAAYLRDTALTLQGSVVTPTIYGSTAANGDIVIEGTSSGTKTTSNVALQPNGGNVGVGTGASPADGQYCQGGSFGSQFCHQYYAASANITATATVTVQVNIPTGVRVLSSACQVSSALAEGEFWDLELNNGAQVLALATGLAVALNTADYDLISNVVTDAETDIVITKSGGGSFTAQGSIECVVHGEYQTALTAH